MTDDNPLLSGYKPPSRRSERIPGELLFQFQVGDVGWRCELRDDGNNGTDAQFFEGDDFRLGRRWQLREVAIAWSQAMRRQLEQGQATF